MSNIISMTGRSSPRAAEPRPEGPAAVIIFPGVRYERRGGERRDEPLADAAGQARSPDRAVN
jgi:hypothetical protein